jgi:hypothetical protein
MLDRNSQHDKITGRGRYQRPVPKHGKPVRRSAMSERDSICASEEKLPSKVCRICCERKPLTEFGPQKREKDGLTSECRACCREIQKRWRIKQGERLVERKRQYRKLNPEKCLQKLTAEQAARYRFQKAQWCRDNPEKTKAHRLVKTALRRGVLIRPAKCGKCGAGGRIEASHDDYSRPLDIEWLCCSCHKIKDMAIARAAKEAS